MESRQNDFQTVLSTILGKSRHHNYVNKNVVQNPTQIREHCLDFSLAL